MCYPSKIQRHCWFPFSSFNHFPHPHFHYLHFDYPHLHHPQFLILIILIFSIILPHYMLNLHTQTERLLLVLFVGKYFYILANNPVIISERLVCFSQT